MATVVATENAGAGGPRAFSPTELQNMLGTCLKMASENKITPQNTWALGLIDQLPALIRDGEQETNFQRASVTLDAGVKIYSYRVDSVHTDTYKILGGLGRASKDTEDDEEAGELGDGGVGDGEEAGGRRRKTHELNPEATLESTLEALNVKKFDLAFTVDPLFHKTSAQFDEGGARGLLLNNLSVFRGCDIVFDSMDVPEKVLDGAQQLDPYATVDLGSLHQQLAAVQLASGAERISPTLDAILELLQEAPADDAAAEAEQLVAQVVASSGGSGSTMPWAHRGEAAPAPQPQNGEDAAAGGAEAMDGAEGGEQQAGEAAMEGVVAEYAHAAAPDPADAAEDYGYDDGGDFGGGDDYYSDDEAQQSAVPGGEQAAAAAAEAEAGGTGAQAGSAAAAATHPEVLGDDAIQWLIEAGSNSMVTRAKGWAGASHWKYRAVPQAAAEEEGEGEQGVTRPKKKSAVRRKNDPLDFVQLMAAAGQEAEAQQAPTFDLLPRREAGAARKARRAKPAAKTLLPEDHHYKVENLNRFALRPRNAIIAGPGEAAAAAAAAAGEAAGEGGGEQPAFDEGDGFGVFGGGGFDDDDDNGGEGGYDGGWGDLGDAFSGLEGMEGEQADMVQATRRVERVEVNYSRAAKQVDVRSLKELMWHGMHSVEGAPPSPDTVLQFQDVLSTVPERNTAGRLDDLSVHLCFICVLHLANEHGLVVQSVPEMNRLLISNVPPADGQ